jgi:putative CocE/NonD family hydrolase
MNALKFTSFLIGFVSLWLFAETGFAQQSEPQYKVIEELDVKVPMRDGIRLSTNIYRPDAEGKFPVVLIRSPYGNGGTNNHEGHFFAERGYVYIIQDTRGRYESEGPFYAMQFEADDGLDMHHWIGEQSWFNGDIGTAGGSYVGFTQWMPAPQSPYLKTMIPAVTFSDFYNTVYQNGAFRLGLFTPWSIEMTHPYNVARETLQEKMDSILLSLPLIEQDRAAGWRIAFLRDWLSHPERDEFWEKTSIGTGNYKKIKASVYNIGGWYDIVLGTTIENYMKMTGDNIPPEIREKQKLLIGPWVHNLGKQIVGELDFGEEATFNGREHSLRWFDRELKGLENGIMQESPVKIFVMGANKWRFENEWPPARATYQKYYFHSEGNANTLLGDGQLSTTSPKEEPADRFIYDPADPVIAKHEMGPYDQTYIEKREDVLVYSTPQLQKDVEVTGPVKVILYASSSAKNTDFTAKLTDVYPDGRSMRICEGIIRASYRDSEKQPSNIEPGKVYEYTINLWATSNLFKKGHQIRVEISSSSIPRFDRNLNTGNNFAPDTTMIKAEQVIYHDKNFPSCIILPVIEESKN